MSSSSSSRSALAYKEGGEGGPSEQGGEAERVRKAQPGECVERGRMRGACAKPSVCEAEGGQPPPGTKHWGGANPETEH